MLQTYSSSHFVDIIFNISSVEDPMWADHCKSKSNVLQLVLSVCNSPEMLFGISFESSDASSQNAVEANERNIPLNPNFARSTLVRGRDAPFPVRLCPDRRITQLEFSSKTLLERRYSAHSQSSTVAGPSKGPLGDQRVLLPEQQHHTSELAEKPPSTMPQRPTLTRSGPRLIYSAPETAAQDEELEEEENKGTSFADTKAVPRKSTLLRVPPFPLPHRALQQQRPPYTSSYTDASTRYKGSRPISKRVSSVPPPLLLLDDIYLWGYQQEVQFAEDSPVLGREEARRLLQCSPAVSLHA